MSVHPACTIPAIFHSLFEDSCMPLQPEFEQGNNFNIICLTYVIFTNSTSWRCRNQVISVNYTSHWCGASLNILKNVISNNPNNEWMWSSHFLMLLNQLQQRLEFFRPFSLLLRQCKEMQWSHSFIPLHISKYKSLYYQQPTLIMLNKLKLQCIHLA